MQRYVQLTPARGAPPAGPPPIRHVPSRRWWISCGNIQRRRVDLHLPGHSRLLFLADRPNATRFNHLFRGMASRKDQEEMVTQLDPVRYVVWDDSGAHSWVGPGDNARLTEYIQANFRVERVLGIYTILSRHAEGPSLLEIIG